MGKVLVKKEDGFFLKKCKISFGDKEIYLRRGETKELDLSPGTYEMLVTSGWVCSDSSFFISGDPKGIVVKSRIPTWLYLLFVCITASSVFLFISHKIELDYLLAWGAICGLLLVYLFIIKRKNFFIIKPF